MSIRENTGNEYAVGGSKEGKKVSWWYIFNLVNCSSIFPTCESCNDTNPNNSLIIMLWQWWSERNRVREGEKMRSVDLIYVVEKNAA